MTDFSPVAYFIDWTHVLNRAMLLFFDAFNQNFSKIGESYVYSARFEKVKIRKFFQMAIDKCLGEIIANIGPMAFSPTGKLYLVGSCKINENILNDIPEKINHVYCLTEKDIKIDMAKMEDIFDRIFTRYFSGKEMLPKSMTVLAHSRLSSLHIQKVLLEKYGNSHFVDCAKMFTKDKIIIVNENDKFVLDSIKELDKQKQKSIKFYEKEIEEQLCRELENRKN